MKGLAGLGAAAFIAAAVALWFTTRPALVVVKARPLTPGPALPTFQRLTDDTQFAPVPGKPR